MQREKPNDDPRQRTDKETFQQTDKPWKCPVEKEQQPEDNLERFWGAGFFPSADGDVTSPHGLNGNGNGNNGNGNGRGNNGNNGPS